MRVYVYLLLLLLALSRKQCDAVMFNVAPGDNDFERCRYLVYTCVYLMKPTYGEMAKLMVYSLRASLQRAPLKCAVDIVLFSSRRTFRTMERLANLNVTFHFTKTPFDSNGATFQKARIFELPNILRYNAVACVDVDMLFNLPSLEALFTPALAAPSQLHVFAEKNFRVTHEYFALGALPFTESEQHDIERRGNVRAFNTGLFVFVPSQIMQREFDGMLRLMERYEGRFFYEQSFMNYWFTARNRVAYSFDTDIIAFKVPLDEEYRALIHFTGTRDPLYEMRKYATRFLPWIMFE